MPESTADPYMQDAARGRHELFVRMHVYMQWRRGTEVAWAIAPKFFCLSEIFLLV